MMDAFKFGDLVMTAKIWYWTEEIIGPSIGILGSNYRRVKYTTVPIRCCPLLVLSHEGTFMRCLFEGRVIYVRAAHLEHFWTDFVLLSGINDVCL